MSETLDFSSEGMSCTRHQSLVADVHFAMLAAVILKLEGILEIGEYLVTVATGVASGQSV